MSTPIDRRTTLKWMLGAAATLPVLGLSGCSQDPTPAAPATGASPAPATSGATTGYGTDPNLLKRYKPGDVWPLVMTDTQRATATALSALILPADEDGPGAVEVGVVAFIDEWISAPYPNHVKAREKILEGFAWLDAEARKRFSADTFAALDEKQKTAICDDICYLPKATPAHRQAAEFFASYRDLTAGGFCTSPQGRTYLRYVGNIPMPSYDGPPPEVLKRVGLG